MEKLLNFINPYLSFIDSGKLYRKPFSWLYVLCAGINVIIPFYVLIKVIDSGIFKHAEGKYIVAFLLVWLVLCVACWVGFQIWWNRKDKVLQTSDEGSEFPVTPVISHLFQTFGEWLGTYIAILGFGISLFGSIMLGSDAHYLAYSMDLPIGSGLIGIGGIVLFPFLGFAIIVVFRYFAELCRCLASIANNTKKTTTNCSENTISNRV